MSASWKGWASQQPTERRKKRALQKYGKNAAGKYVRMTSFRECDYTPSGRLREFSTEEDFLAFEEDRYMNGHSLAHYSKVPKSTVPEEQLALENAVRHTVEDDGNKTRVQLQGMEEGIHERHDEHQATLCEIRTHQLQQDKEQSAILEKKAALAEMQRAKNDAFASRVEAGDCTPLEEKELQLKILAEEIRRAKAEARLEKQREKARKQQEKEGKAARKKASADSGGAPSKRRRLTSTPGGEEEAQRSDGLGCAAAPPPLQPSRTASSASPVSSSAGSSGSLDNSGNRKPFGVGAEAPVSLTANQTAAIPEAQGKQRRHDGCSSNVSTAASTPVSVASAARAPEVEAGEANSNTLCEQRQQLIERGGRQFTEITHVFREGRCPAGFNPGDEFGVKQYVNIFTEEELRSFENRVDEMIADDEPWLANTLDVSPPDAIGDEKWKRTRTKYFFPKYTYGKDENGKNQTPKRGDCTAEPLPPGVVCKRCKGAQTIVTEQCNNIPAWIYQPDGACLARHLVELGILENGWATSAILNVYNKKGGKLLAHFDSPHLFERLIVALSLFSGKILSFGVKGFGMKPQEIHYDVDMPRGAITIMYGYAANKVNHGVKPVTEKAASLLLRRMHPSLLGEDWCAQNTVQVNPSLDSPGGDEQVHMELSGEDVDLDMYVEDEVNEEL